MNKRLKYSQIIDGEAVKITRKTGIHRISCCDCGLVHDIVYKPRKRYVLLYVQRNFRATAAKRRYLDTPIAKYARKCRYLKKNMRKILTSRKNNSIIKARGKNENAKRDK
jgi:hypothetical protein